MYTKRRTKMHYEEPELLLWYLNESDIVATSGGSDDDDGENNWTGEWDTEF